MAAKKQAAPTKEQKHKNPSIQVRIDRLNDYEGSSVKAFASANIGGAFAIHGIRVVDSQKGLFVSMPQNSYKDGNGNTKYSDIFHAVTAEARTELNEKVIDAYEQAVQAQEQQDEAAEENDTQGMAPSM